MSKTISLRCESRLQATPGEVWAWITSVQGIAAEMAPYLRMTTPRHVRSLTDIDIQPGVRLFRSHLLLFGILPVDHSDLTLLELREGRGFIEQSPMGSMKSWRHERLILPGGAAEPDAVVLIDQITFEPRFCRRLTRSIVRRFFAHRHDVLRKNLRGCALRSGHVGYEGDGHGAHAAHG
jgi:ligand-binding SRPBCC domain-containing protein